MALWLNHPVYQLHAQRLIERLKSKKYRFPPTPPIVFLCGATESDRRKRLRQYLEGVPAPPFIFYADDVWFHIAKTTNLNASQIEDLLARLSDLVIIIVESPGTFAELGAFAHSDTLRPKVLPIIDSKYRNKESFIITGPTQWIERDSLFKPTIYVPLDKILLCTNEVDERLARVKKPKTSVISNLSKSNRYLLFFMCDLIKIVAPVSVEQIVFLLSAMVDGLQVTEVHSLIGLAIAMNLISFREIDGEYFYFAPPHSLNTPFRRRRYLDLSEERASYLNGIMSVKEHRTVMEKIYESYR